MTIDHPALEPIAEERAEIDVREATLRASIRALVDPYNEEVAAWKVLHDDALALGAGPPKKPDPPDTAALDREIRHLDARREKLVRAERKVLAGIAPEIEAGLAAQRDEVLVQVAPHVAEIEVARQRLAAILRDAHTVRSAVDLADPNERPAPGYRLKARSLQEITTGDVIAAVTEGVDLLALSPLPRTNPTAPQVDRSPVEERGGGLSPAGAFGRPPPPPRVSRGREDFL